ncbi:MAG: glycosyltransferase family 2 protein, partial [Candidatus Glassbacteria bacterium]|nr:glycosyltransferase family 2 protein [Candidatus Glassbacteria bacterium]
TPGQMLARLLGLARLFPHSRAFAGYTYGDLSESATHRIDSASGSFLFFRRELLEKVGEFDERFFMYAEDLDWCRRARQKGFGIYYFPGTSVVHLQGAGSRQRALKSLWHLHYTAFLYIRKHHCSDYSFALRMILAVALAMHFTFAVALTLMARLFTRAAKQK